MNPVISRIESVLFKHAKQKDGKSQNTFSSFRFFSSFNRFERIFSIGLSEVEATQQSCEMFNKFVVAQHE